ncbi:SirB2 family protein [Marinicellulosiphila megalodicopiae]|uniref:SirB2 family protein n=1 Tax=Marinicellulosiphila megalodicopiae TaxID=2724896 RepID=UPI003BAEBF9F
MIYTILKHSHMTLALLSIIGFVVRAYFSFYKPELLKIKVIKITPHIIDTFLLITAISLVLLMDYGLANWILAKIGALVIYIGLGIIVIKQIGPIYLRTILTFTAVLMFIYIASVAITKQVVPF